MAETHKDMGPWEGTVFSSLEIRPRYLLFEIPARQACGCEMFKKSLFLVPSRFRFPHGSLGFSWQQPDFSNGSNPSNDPNRIPTMSKKTSWGLDQKIKTP
jgi:hypothetical protein